MVSDGRAGPPAIAFSFKECRHLAATVRRSTHWRTARRTVRPRGWTGVFRSRAPLPVLLYRAAREGRLITNGAGGVALLEPPGGQRDVAPDHPTLRALDTYWDVLVFFLSAVVLLAASAAAAILGARTVGLILAVAVICYVGILMAAGTIRTLATLAGGRKRLIQTAMDQLRARTWTTTLLHAPGGPDEAVALVAQSLTRLHDQPRLLIAAGGITAASPVNREMGDVLVQPLSPHHPALVAYRRDAPRWETSVAPGKISGRALSLLLAATGTVLAVLTWFVADAERQLCGQDCDGVPASYGDALYWLLSRLTGGDPDGLGPVSPWSRLVGLLVTIFGVYVLVTIIGTVVRQRVDDDLRSGSDVVTTFERQRPSAERPNTPPATVTTTDTDRFQTASAVFLGVSAGIAFHATLRGIRNVGGRPRCHDRRRSLPLRRARTRRSLRRRGHPGGEPLW